MSAVRGLNVVGLPLFDNDVILFDRFGNSGGMMVDINETVSLASAFAIKFICDSDNDAIDPCIPANTENSWAVEQMVDIVPVGESSPSLLLL